MLDVPAQIPPQAGWALTAGAGAVAAVAVVWGLRWLVKQLTRIVLTGDAQRRRRLRDIATGSIQYALLYFFWAVAASISASGLIGFGNDNMELGGPLPYLLFFALDGAAAMCMVLLYRRASRKDSALVVRLFVWALVVLSAWFNWSHAPDNPGAHIAYAAFPAIAGVLFEFALHETRKNADREDRQLTEMSWLHPIERMRVRQQLSGDKTLSAAEATRRVRINRAAQRLHQLRQALAGAPTVTDATSPRARWIRGKQRGTRTARWAQRRARSALTRVGFADPAVALEVLRQMQVLTRTCDLATLDYSTPEAAYTILDALIISTTSSGADDPRGDGNPTPEQSVAPAALMPAARAGLPNQIVGPADAQRTGEDRAHRFSTPHSQGAAGHTNGRPAPPSRQTRPLPRTTAGSSAAEVETATEAGARVRRRNTTNRAENLGSLLENAAILLAEARQRGEGLTLTALAEGLRSRGFGIANNRVRWVADQIGLSSPGVDRRKEQTVPWTIPTAPIPPTPGGGYGLTR